MGESMPKRYQYTVPRGDSAALMVILQHMVCTLAEVGPELSRVQLERVHQELDMSAVVLDQYAAVCRSVRSYRGAVPVYDLAVYRARHDLAAADPVPDDPRQLVMFTPHTMSGRLYGSGT